MNSFNFSNIDMGLLLFFTAVGVGGLLVYFSSKELLMEGR